MKKTIFLFLFVSLIFVQTKKEEIINFQKTKERVFIDVQVKPVYKINLDSLKEIIFRLEFLEIDEEQNIYAFDYSEMKFHRLTYKNNKILQLSSNSKKGEGPGEFLNPTDFKIYNKKIYLPDVYTGRVEVYSTEGKYLYAIKSRSNKIPVRVLPLKNNLIIQPRGYEENALFEIVDYEGIVKNKFGKSITNKFEATIGEDGRIIPGLNEQSFYYIAGNMGVIKKFVNNKVIYTKFTIDGENKGPEKITKKIKDGNTLTKYDQKYYPVAAFAANKNYIFIKVRDTEKDKRYYDVYSLDEFNYLFSVKSFPLFNMFALKGDMMCCYDKDLLTLRIFDIKDLNAKIEKSIKKLKQR